MKSIRRFSKRGIVIIISVIIFVLAYLYAPRPRADDDIRTSMFQYLLKSNGSALQEKASAYFLSVGGMDHEKDPSKSLIQRFAGLTPPALPISQSVSDNHYRPRRAVTGKRGVILYAGRITWIHPHKALIVAGYYEDSMSASGGTYVMVFRNGKWFVANVLGFWVS